MNLDMEEMLISMIQQKPVLWQKNHPQHKNSYAVGRAWDEIATNLGQRKDTIRNKWKSLKNRFVDELKKFPKYKSGAAAVDYISSWPHFKAMKFYTCQITPNVSSGNLTELCNNSDSDDDLMDVHNAYADIMSESQMNVQPKKSGKQTKTDQFVNLESRKIALMEKCLLNKENVTVTNKNDELQKEDMKFFETLLPYTKMLSDMNKLIFRKDTTELVMNLITSQNVASTVLSKDDGSSEGSAESDNSLKRKIKTEITDTKRRKSDPIKTTSCKIETGDDSDIEIVEESYDSNIKLNSQNQTKIKPKSVFNASINPTPRTSNFNVHEQSYYQPVHYNATLHPSPGIVYIPGSIGGIPQYHNFIRNFHNFDDGQNVNNSRSEASFNPLYNQPLRQHQTSSENVPVCNTYNSPVIRANCTSAQSVATASCAVLQNPEISRVSVAQGQTLMQPVIEESMNRPRTALNAAVHEKNSIIENDICTEPIQSLDLSLNKSALARTTSTDLGNRQQLEESRITKNIYVHSAETRTLQIIGCSSSKQET